MQVNNLRPASGSPPPAARLAASVTTVPWRGAALKFPRAWICQLQGDRLNHRRPRVQTGKRWPARGTSSGSTQSPLSLRVPALHRRRMPVSGRSRTLRSQQCGSRLGSPPALATLTNTSSHGLALSPPGISRETQLSKKSCNNCSQLLS